MINHVVLFRWKPGTSQAKIDEIYRELEGLKRLIPGLQSFSGGPYSSREGMNQGYTHGFIMTFTHAPARDDGEEADIALRQTPSLPNRSLHLVQGLRREPDLLAARPDCRQQGLGQ